ncbi:hypothetical protein TNCV_4366731 [Trichonephila clavipes]|nr:hypothetical protein TNCV_4366731 [Trichonephila clavipes]
MTIAALKDLIIGSEDYDEELTKNIHSTIVEDRKAREEYLRIEEQKEKLRLKNEKKITLRTIELMQISAENLQEELDLRHVENRQIKKELEKLIQDYKPEKQHLLTSQ